MYKDREKYLANQRKYNRTHSKQRVELSRKWKLENPEKAKEQNRRMAMKYYYDPKSVIKWKARKKLRYEVSMGRIAKYPCVECGDIKSQAHHEDYSKPLEVIWLCRKHHMEKHKKI